MIDLIMDDEEDMVKVKEFEFEDGEYVVVFNLGDRLFLFREI